MADMDPNKNNYNTGGGQPNPNQQAGTDQFGNPINAFGLPLGQSPPAPGSGGPTPNNIPSEGPGFFGTVWNTMSGNNKLNPMEGAPVIHAPTMTAETMTATQMGAAGMNTAQADADRAAGLAARSDQSQLGTALMQRALGQGGPSVAELQMQRGVGLAQQAAARQAASARGIGRGLASYGAMNAQADLAAQGVQDAAALRAQEQIGAQGLASKHLSDQRMQDLTSRGMSIQQAQAIMDAENRARELNMAAVNRANETNMGAINQARSNNQQTALSTNQSNLEAETARRGYLTTISEGNAQRKQQGVGGIMSAAGGLLALSDVRAKQDVQPLLYQAPLQAPEAEPLSRPEPARVVELGGKREQRELADAIVRKQQENQQFNAPAAESRIGGGALVMNPRHDDPFKTPEPAQVPQQGGGGFLAGLGGGLMAGGAVLSDKNAKENAFKAGLVVGASAPVMQKAAVSSAPAFDVSPERVTRVGRETFHQAVAERDKKNELAKAFSFLGKMQGWAPQIRAQAEPAPAQPTMVPVAQVQPPPTATSDERAKYTYSDERAKKLESENEMLKAALGRMGNEVSGKIRGDDPGLGDALTRMGREADVSSIPTAAYPDITSDQARSANPPPPYQYRYKDEFAAKQGTDTEPRLGIMAQDALKSPMYRPAVVEMPDGMLGIDSNRLLHANTAMLSGEHQRLNEAEERDRKLAEAIAALGNRRAAEIGAIR